MAKRINVAQVLWIDADPVFGGSKSQVQFPAELRLFFSLPANPHMGQHVFRSIHFGGMTFEGKKMDFHHNDMWRLNLPTTKQGLGGYEGRLLVFEKTKDEKVYSLWVVEKETSIAKKLRAHTAAFGKVGFKLKDSGGKRWYGFF